MLGGEHQVVEESYGQVVTAGFLKLLGALELVELLALSPLAYSRNGVFITIMTPFLRVAVADTLHLAFLPLIQHSENRGVNRNLQLKVSVGSKLSTRSEWV